MKQDTHFYDEIFDTENSLMSNDSATACFSQSEIRSEIRFELRTLSELCSLRLCRICLIVLLFIMTPFCSLRQFYMPSTFPTLLCYLFLYLIYAEIAPHLTRRLDGHKKSQRMHLQSLASMYHYKSSTLLTERLSFWSAFPLLGLLQYSFLHNTQLSLSVLCYAPTFLAVLLLLIRYLGQAFYRCKLHHKLLYRD